MDSPSVTTEAASAPAPLSASDKVAAFEEFLDPEEVEEETQPEDQDGAEEGDDLDLEDEVAGEEEVEPEAAIDAPISLNADEKKVFAQLPPEAQQAWAASETRRNAQVQEATTKASDAQRNAEQRAAQADAEAKSVYGQQLEQFAQAFAPAPPDPRNYSDQLSYLTDEAHHRTQMAQHDDLMQHVRGLQTEASAEAAQAFVAARDRELMTIPEVANPETRSDYLDRAMGVAEALGYDRDTLARNADAADIKAMAQAAEWKAKADRFDKAMSKQMQKVRAQKGKNLRPNAAPQASSRAADGKAWQNVKQARSKEAQAEAFADFMNL